MTDQNEKSVSGHYGSQRKIIKEISLENIGEALDMKKNVYGIFRHIPLIFMTTLIFTALFSYLSYKLLHTYSAEAVLIFQQSEKVQNTSQDNFEQLHLSLASAVEMVTLSANLKAVKSILGLDLAIEQIKQMIAVDVAGKNSNLINISVSTDNPSLAIDIANTLANVAVRNSQQLSQKQLQSAYKFFENQQANLKTKLQQQLAIIAQFRQDNRLTGVDVFSTNTGTSLTEAELRLETANSDYTRMLVEYENLKREYEKIPDKIPKSPLDAEGSAMKSRVVQIQLSLLDARSRLAPDNPKIKALERQLTELYKASADDENPNTPKVYEPNPLKEKLNLELMTMNARLRAAKKLREEMAENMRKLHEDMNKMTQVQMRLTQLVGDKIKLEEQIKSAEIKMRSLEVGQNLGKSDVELYHEADKAFSPENSILYMLLPIVGFLLGSSLGIASAFTLEFFDKKIRTPKQLEISYTVPYIACIPEMQDLERSNAQKKLLSYVRTIVERLTLIAGPFRVLTILSSQENEGKSTLAFFLAQYYQQIGKTAIIIEFDYRANPHYDPHEEPAKGLENYLMGQATVDEITYQGNPHRIKAHYDPAMKELVKTNKMDQLMQELKEQYDIIIIDSPGIVDDEYAINLIELSQASLFVIGSSKVNKGIVDSSLKKLDDYHLAPSALIFNRVLALYLDDPKILKEFESEQGQWMKKLTTFLKR